MAETLHWWVDGAGECGPWLCGCPLCVYVWLRAPPRCRTFERLPNRAAPAGSTTCSFTSRRAACSSPRGWWPSGATTSASLCRGRRSRPPTKRVRAWGGCLQGRAFGHGGGRWALGQGAGTTAAGSLASRRPGPGTPGHHQPHPPASTAHAGFDKANGVLRAFTYGTMGPFWDERRAYIDRWLAGAQRRPTSGRWGLHSAAPAAATVSRMCRAARRARACHPRTRRHYQGLEPRPTQFRTCLREDDLSMTHVSTLGLGAVCGCVLVMVVVRWPCCRGEAPQRPLRAPAARPGLGCALFCSCPA